MSLQKLAEPGLGVLPGWQDRKIVLLKDMSLLVMNSFLFVIEIDSKEKEKLLAKTRKVASNARLEKDAMQN